MKHLDYIKENIKNTTIIMDGKIEEVKKEFEPIINGEFNSILISEPAGVGKTTLLMKALEELLSYNVTYVYVKCEQYKQESYHIFKELIDQIIDTIFTLSNEKLIEIKSELEKALGDDLSILLLLNPKWEKIFGNIKKKDKLDYTSTKTKLKKVVYILLEKISQIVHPFTIFLDDIQWIDEISIDILEYLYQKENKLNVFLILACRNDTAVYEKEIKKILVRHSIKRISVNNLNLYDTRLLIEKILYMDINNLDEISKKIYSLSFGNPFYIKQLLNDLIDNNILFYKDDKWSLKFDIMNEYKLDDNIKSIMKYRINILDEDIKTLLNICSCMGRVIKKDILYNIKDIQKISIEYGLNELLQHGFMLENKESEYEFVHDIIYQTIYENIEENKKKKIHYEIGIYSLNNCEELMIFAANQLLNSEEVLIENANIDTINKLYRAGIKSIELANIKFAYSILSLCEDILPEDCFLNHYKISMDIKKALINCKLLDSDYEGVIHRLDNLIDKVNTNEDIAEIKYMYILFYSYNDNHKKVIELGIEALKYLNYKMDLNHINYNIIKKYISNRFLLHKNERRNDKRYNIKLIHSILIKMAFSGYFIDDLIFKYILYNIINISFKTNDKDYILSGYITYCFMLNTIYNKPLESKKYIDIIKDRIPFIESNDINFMAHFVLGSFAEHEFSQIQNSINYLEKSFDYAINCGNFLYGQYSAIMLRQIYYIKGESLEDIKNNKFIIDKYEEKLKNINMKWEEYIFKHHISYLQDSSMQIDISGQEESIDRLDDSIRIIYYYYKLQRLYLIGELSLAYEIVDNVHLIADKLKSFIIYKDLIFFITIIRLDKHKDLNSFDKIKNKKFIDMYLKQFTNWVSLVDTHKTRLDIIKAKYNHIFKKNQNLIMELDNIASEAGKRFELYLEIICYNSILNICNSKNISKYYAEEIKKLYQKWGAYRLVSLSEKKYEPCDCNILAKSNSIPDYKHTNKNIIENDILIYISYIRNLDKDNMFLYTLDLFMEKTDLKYGAVMLKNKDSLCIKYEAKQGKDSYKYNEAFYYEDMDYIAKKIIRYVNRSHEEVLVQKNNINNIFKSDMYIKDKNDITLLCIPLMYSDVFAGVIYLQWEKNNISMDIIKRIRSFSFFLITRSLLEDNLIKKEDIELDGLLTNREIEILNCIAEGMTNKKISEELFISYSTTTTHIENIYRKLEVNNRVKAVIKATRAGII